ncbi:MAG: hypothetical protein N2038_03620 [Geminicoccaceae bacterium]|nr:hypothetical protein [Geminicoccaceae bacterium]MCS7268511.1 hypothetical protein [Geminicoccaceae bacterium]MCX7629320.1 hypothetical protein [Geminicoccaceae bacterium]MDW8125695.1 hypothetical protein [Geminicoccaceae bacterium]MDW8341885.1 hypothetical protein [Geminicoccaceae bacterium]
MGYTVEQRRDIANALLADREEARWEGEQLRFRTGKTALPPPPEPARPALSPPRVEPPPAPRPPVNVESAIVAERMRAETDDGSLNAFLRRLVHGRPTPREPDEPPSWRAEAAAPPSSAAKDEKEPAPQKPPARAEKAEEPPALDRFLEFLGGVLAVGRTPAPPEPAPDAAADASAARAEPAAAASARAAPTTAPNAPVAPVVSRGEHVDREEARRALPRPRPPHAGASPENGPSPVLAAISFPAGGASPMSDAREEVRRAVDKARTAEGGIEVVGHGAHPALALERARAVARLVLEAGAPAERVSLRAAGPGDRVELLLRSR